MKDKKEFPKEAIKSLPKGYKAFWGGKKHEDWSDKGLHPTLSWRDGKNRWDDTGWSGGESSHIYARPAHMMKGTLEPATSSPFPEDAAERKTYPVFSGCLSYFPNALAAVAKCSYDGNQQHHPDEPLHWDKSKSTDEADALIRHLIEGEYDKVAWRALALCERSMTGTL